MLLKKKNLGAGFTAMRSAIYNDDAFKSKLNDEWNLHIT